MSKLTKIQARNHQQAQNLLAQDMLTWDDKLFVLENWREDAEHVNGIAGAFFTPWGLALDLALHIVGDRVVDLCAGIGTLSLAYWQRCELDRREGRQLDLVCVESNPDYDAGCAIADHGAFIVPQQSAGFLYSGRATGYQRSESDRYKRFEHQTGIVLDAGSWNRGMGDPHRNGARWPHSRAGGSVRKTVL